MRKNDVIILDIEELNNLGYGVSHVTNEDGTKGLVVFVHGAVTGDRVEAKIIKVQKSYLVAKAERMLSPSPYRIEPDCRASGCGGCLYRAIDYQYELTLKRDYVASAFRKAGLSDVTVEAVQSTGALSGYRNKAQYPIREGKGGIEAGFFAASSHRIVPSDGCRLQPKIFSEILGFVIGFAKANRLTAYNEETGKGLLCHLFLRMGAATGEIMVCPVINGTTLPNARGFAEDVMREFPSVTSVMVNYNLEHTNVILGERFDCIGGKPYIEDILCNRRFRISAGSFYQVNHDACELLYSIAAERAGEGDTLLDLYCGIGTIGLSMSDRFRRIVGIEIVEEAVRCASENAERNGCTNAAFYCGDASDAQRLLTTAEASMGDLSGATVIMDPPRKGSTEELITYLANRNFSRIVYVSCNPDTLARDCALLRKLGYEIGAVTPVDLFPRTGHVESVVLLTKSGTEHRMKLHASPFEAIKSGKKTIELRLYDEKRQAIKVGDTIVFTSNEGGKTLRATVKHLHHFHSFEELYKSLPLLQCGYTEADIASAHPSDMEAYYSKEEQARYGVVGIELAICQ